jgi:hypothetical protein
MGNHSAAPPGGSGGGGFDENIGLGKHDLKSLTHLPLTEILRRVTARELTWRAGHCAGCKRRYHEDEQPAGSGIWVWPLLNGVVFYTLCGNCIPLTADPDFQERIREEAYRSLFEAGPDDVDGSA